MLIFFFQAEDGIRDKLVTGVQTCALPISFAYEPSRLGDDAIRAHLRQTKGEFRRVKSKGHEVLEVLHGGERLTFPPWKFDVYGPLALLDLLSRKGKLCILSAVDMEAFWELLSQLLPEDTARPHGVVFTESNVRRSEEHTSELQSLAYLVCRLLLEKKKTKK